MGYVMKTDQLYAVAGEVGIYISDFVGDLEQYELPSSSPGIGGIIGDIFGSFDEPPWQERRRIFSRWVNWFAKDLDWTKGYLNTNAVTKHRFPLDYGTTWQPPVVRFSDPAVYNSWALPQNNSRRITLHAKGIRHAFKHRVH